ncbi:MAG: hypothetical protein NVSMB52_18730 [Chloroflexota bacterium]
MEMKDTSEVQYSPEDASEQFRGIRENFARLSRRYHELAWSSSAKDQRECSLVKAALMKIFVDLHPNSGYREYDDFDSVAQSVRQA